MRATLSALVTLGLVVSACTASAETTEPVTSASSTSTTPASTSTAPSTTVTVPRTTGSTTETPEHTSLINGTPISDPELLERRVLAVKIDNHPLANPQSGINHADMVIELMVEGITRYLTIWHESDTEYLGPIRSGRPTDPTLLAAMNAPTFVISGAQNWVQRFIVAHDVHLIGEVGQPQTFRIPTRRAPHNLYVDTPALRDYADLRGYPDEPPAGPLWEFGPMSDLAQEVRRVTIDFSGNTVIWDWDETTGMWLRTGYGVESTYRDEEGNDFRLGVPVMVALYVDQYLARPPAGASGSSVPGSRTTGSGKAFVFADGHVEEGTWTRDAETEWFTLTGADGNALLVPPGKVWVSLVPAHRGLIYE